MENALTWVSAHKVLLIGLAYALLNFLNGVLPYPKAQSVMHRLMDGLSMLTRSNSPGTLKIPLTSSKDPG